ncbi:unnamed protein product [Closterium sp. NIES-54]
MPPCASLPITAPQSPPPATPRCPLHLAALPHNATTHCTNLVSQPNSAYLPFLPLTPSLPPSPPSLPSSLTHSLRPPLPPCLPPVHPPTLS